MIDRSCKFSVRRISLTLSLLLLAANTAWAQAPSINWSLDEAIGQIERQAKDFDTALARIELVRTADDGTEGAATKLAWLPLRLGVNPGSIDTDQPVNMIRHDHELAKFNIGYVLRNRCPARGNSSSKAR